MNESGKFLLYTGKDGAVKVVTGFTFLVQSMS